MRGLATLFALIMAVLAGCATVPMASMEADSSAKQFQPRKGYSNIYLYRNEAFGGAFAFTVSLDGKVMGKTGPQTYFLWEVAPGKHSIAVHAENTATLDVDAKEGRNHYVWQEVKMGFWQPRALLHEMSEEAGRKGVLECKRATAEN